MHWIFVDARNTALTMRIALEAKRFKHRDFAV